MPDVLSSREFSTVDLPIVQGFNCGGDEWAKKASDWISGPESENLALISIRKFATRIWLYFNVSGSLVGFAALGKTKWPEYERRNGIVVQMAVSIQFQGHPKGPDEIRYSHQILDDAIARAQLEDVDWLLLTVAPGNTAARKLYDKFEFQEFGGLSPLGHIKMRLRLR